jgi:hypothetical protein
MTRHYKHGDKVWVQAVVSGLQTATKGDVHVSISSKANHSILLPVPARSIRPRVKRTQPESQWLSIRTAPTDGTLILATWARPGPDGREVLLIQWEGGEWTAAASFAPLCSEPTHWAPIPAFPENAK